MRDLRCPITMPDGSDCWRKPHPDSKHQICPEHWSAVVQDFESKRAYSGKRDEPTPLGRFRCPSCGQLGFSRPGTPFQCTNDLCADPSPTPARTELSLTEIAAIRWAQLGAAIFQDPRTVGWVYYLRFGDRIKIGTSRDVRQRLRSLQYDELLAVEPGSYIVERERHRQFGALLITGQREWFRVDPTLLAHIAAVRAEHGEPRRYLTRPA